MRVQTPRLRPLSAAISKQTGFGLTETLLVLGAISVMSLAVYGVFFASDVTAEVKAEQNNLNSLSTAVDRSFGLTGGFSGLSLAQVKQDGLLPTAYQRSGSIQTEWGSAVDVRAYGIPNPASNNAFVIDYANVPGEACSKLAAAMAPNVYELRIGGTNVMTADGMDAAAAARACSAGARMEFVYYSGLTTGTAVATPPLTLPPAPPSINPTNPSTPVGPVGGAPSVGDATPGTPGVVAPGTPVDPPPAVPAPPPAPATPTLPQPIPGGSTTPIPPSLSRCVPNVAPPNTQNVATCPAGYWGLVQQQQTLNSSCPEAWAAPHDVWSGWSNTGNNTCQACPAPYTQSQTNWVTRSAACPAGTTGMASQQWEQVSYQTFTYNCPEGTTTLPGATGGGWSGWADTGNARAVDTSGCTPIPPPATGCYVMTDWSNGVQDVSDAYYSISYSLNGGGNSCSVTMRDDGPGGGGSPKCNAGSNGILDLGTWAQQAANGDTYYVSGSQSGWGGGRGEFWGFDNYTYTRMSGAVCSGGTSTGDYDVVGTPYCGSETHYNLPTLDAQARSMCAGQPRSTLISNIHSFPQFQVGCYTNVVCK